NGRAPITRNWRTTRSSVPGGTIWLRNPSSVAATNSVRVCTMMAAALVSIGKNESIAEYAAPLPDPMQPSLKGEIRLRRISHQKVRRFISTVLGGQARRPTLLRSSHRRPRLPLTPREIGEFLRSAAVCHRRFTERPGRAPCSRVIDVDIGHRAVL